MATAHGDKLHGDLARSVLIMASLGDMPDSFWHSDRRIGQALYMLGWTVDDGRNWAADHPDWAPTG